MKFFEALIALGHFANAIFVLMMIGRDGWIRAYGTSFIMAVAIVVIALSVSFIVKGMS